MTSDTIISHIGTSKAMRLIMVMGDVKGIIESQKASDEPGFCITDIDATSAMMTGSVGMVESL